jgi:hypothetical protein
MFIRCLSTGVAMTLLSYMRSRRQNLTEGQAVFWEGLHPFQIAGIAMVGVQQTKKLTWERDSREPLH